MEMIARCRNHRIGIHLREIFCARYAQQLYKGTHAQCWSGKIPRGSWKTEEAQVQTLRHKVVRMPAQKRRRALSEVPLFWRPILIAFYACPRAQIYFIELNQNTVMLKR
jgi:hypothetical protein